MELNRASMSTIVPVNCSDMLIYDSTV